MSNIVEHVTSKELSERLMDLGVRKGQSYFGWINDKNEFVFTYDTYLSSKLGEMLPNGLHQIITTTKDNNKWLCTCEEIQESLRKEIHRELADTEVECKGLMLEYLIENKLITLF